MSGIGVVSPIGQGCEAFWTALTAGRVGIRPIHAFDASPYEVKIAAEVLDFDPWPWLAPAEQSRLGRQAQFAVAAARMAAADAGLEREALGQVRAGVALGVLAGEGPTTMRLVRDHLRGCLDPRRLVDAYAYPFHAPAAVVSEALGLSGPSHTIYAACASGNQAIAFGLELLRAGSVDMMLCGGADVLLEPGFAAFHNWRALAPDCCRPFDRNRKGLVVGEGAAILVLEPLGLARARGRIRAELLGCGVSCDAFHMSAPHPDGDGAVQAMRQALRAARLSPERVDLICAHGTGTVLNDRAEALALRRVFGRHLDALPVTSAKSMLGHAMGAASALGAVICCLAVQNDVVPPTVNHIDPDPACALPVLPVRAQRHAVRVAMNNAFGFGGNNAIAIFAKYEDT